MPRHQAQVVVNRNHKLAMARARPAPVVQVSSASNEDTSVFELDGRLTLVQERDIDWKVPVRIAERDAPDVEKINNPINQLGALHSACVPIVTSNDPVSYAAAVNKRSNFQQLGPSDDIDDDAFKQAKAVIRALPDLFKGDEWMENDHDRESWLSGFDESKKKRMREAWANAGDATLKELTSKSGSVKREVLTGKRFDKSAAGRIIYAGTDVFNAVTGPAQKEAMRRLVLLLEHTTDGQRTLVGNIEVMLGYKADDHELAAFIIDQRFKECVEGDFSRNDREQRSRVAELTDLWFEKLGFPEWYRDLMFQMEHYTLTNLEFGLQVKLCFQLATGTTNTTFRNSTYNITMFAVACLRQNRRGKALVLGDDLLAVLNKRLNLNEWVKTVADFKMVLKAKSPRLNGHATFLSRRIFAEVETPFMVPLLGKMLVRFNARANQNQSISDSQAMAAKALSYAFGCKNLHLLRDIFLRRFEMEDDSALVSVEDLGWNVRQNGWTTDQIVEMTKRAPNLIDDFDFSCWCTDVYDLDYLDVVELFEMTILNVSLEILEDPRIENMRMDYE